MKPSRILWLSLGVILLVLAATSALTGQWAIVASGFVLVIFVAGFAGLQALLAAQRRDQRLPESEQRDAVPASHVPEGDDGRPLGDTPEAHDELSPHDVPVGHPGRIAAEKQAEGDGAEGTTAGHADGGAAPAEDRETQRG